MSFVYKSTPFVSDMNALFIMTEHLSQTNL